MNAPETLVLGIGNLLWADEGFGVRCAEAFTERYALPPGTLKLVEDDEVPRFMGAKKMSLHQTGFQEVIAAAELTGRCPAAMALVGVQPAELEDFGGSLTPAVRARLPEAVALGVERLARWGVRSLPRATGAARRDQPALALGPYEAG